MVTISGPTYEITHFHRMHLRGGIHFEEISSILVPIDTQTINVVDLVRVYPDEYPNSFMEKVTSDSDLMPQFSRCIFDRIVHKANWKLPPNKAFVIEDQVIAIFLAQALTYETGGAWIIEVQGEYRPEYYVWTKGYYYYIGF